MPPTANLTSSSFTTTHSARAPAHDDGGSTSGRRRFRIESKTVAHPQLSHSPSSSSSSSKSSPGPDRERMRTRSTPSSSTASTPTKNKNTFPTSRALMDAPTPSKGRAKPIPVSTSESDFGSVAGAKLRLPDRARSISGASSTTSTSRGASLQTQDQGREPGLGGGEAARGRGARTYFTTPAVMESEESPTLLKRMVPSVAASQGALQGKALRPSHPKSTTAALASSSSKLPSPIVAHSHGTSSTPPKRPSLASPLPPTPLVPAAPTPLGVGKRLVPPHALTLSAGTETQLRMAGSPPHTPQPSTPASVFVPGSGSASAPASSPLANPKQAWSHAQFVTIASRPSFPYFSPSPSPSSVSLSAPASAGPSSASSESPPACTTTALTLPPDSPSTKALMKRLLAKPAPVSPGPSTSGSGGSNTNSTGTVGFVMGMGMGIPPSGRAMQDEDTRGRETLKGNVTRNIHADRERERSQVAKHQALLLSERQRSPLPHFLDTPNAPPHPPPRSPNRALSLSPVSPRTAPLHAPSLSQPHLLSSTPVKNTPPGFGQGFWSPLYSAMESPSPGVGGEEKEKSKESERNNKSKILGFLRSTPSTPILSSNASTSSPSSSGSPAPSRSGSLSNLRLFSAAGKPKPGTSISHTHVPTAVPPLFSRRAVSPESPVVFAPYAQGEPSVQVRVQAESPLSMDLPSSAASADGVFALQARRAPLDSPALVRDVDLDLGLGRKEEEDEMGMYLHPRSHSNMSLSLSLASASACSVARSTSILRGSPPVRSPITSTLADGSGMSTPVSPLSLHALEGSGAPLPLKFDRGQKEGGQTPAASLVEAYKLQQLEKETRGLEALAELAAANRYMHGEVQAEERPQGEEDDDVDDDEEEEERERVKKQQQQRQHQKLVRLGLVPGPVTRMELDTNVSPDVLKECKEKRKSPLARRLGDIGFGLPTPTTIAVTHLPLTSAAKQDDQAPLPKLPPNVKDKARRMLVGSDDDVQLKTSANAKRKSHHQHLHQQSLGHAPPLPLKQSQPQKRSNSQPAGGQRRHSYSFLEVESPDATRDDDAENRPRPNVVFPGPPSLGRRSEQSDEQPTGPYYTVFGSTSGRVVAVGGPEDSWDAYSLGHGWDSVLGQRVMKGQVEKEKEKAIQKETYKANENDKPPLRRSVSQKVSDKWKKPSNNDREGMALNTDTHDRPRRVGSTDEELRAKMRNRRSLRLSIDKFPDDERVGGEGGSSRAAIATNGNGEDSEGEDEQEFGVGLRHRAVMPQNTASTTTVSNGNTTTSTPKGAESGSSSPGGGRFWKLMRRLSIGGGLRDKFQQHTHGTGDSPPPPPPPVPALPKNTQPLLGSRSTDSSLRDLSKPPLSSATSPPMRTSTPSRMRVGMAGRPSPPLPTGAVSGPRPSTTTRSSSPVSSSDVASSKFFHRTHSARSSSSSFSSEPPPPPLPPPKSMLAQHIIAPSELRRVHEDDERKREREREREREGQRSPTVGTSTTTITSIPKTGTRQAPPKPLPLPLPPAVPFPSTATATVTSGPVFLPTITTARNKNTTTAPRMTALDSSDSKSNLLGLMAGAGGDEDWMIVSSPSVELESLPLPPPKRAGLVFRAPSTIASSSFFPSSLSSSAATNANANSASAVVLEDLTPIIGTPESPTIPMFSTSDAVNAFPPRAQSRSTNSPASVGSSSSPFTPAPALAAYGPTPGSAFVGGATGREVGFGGSSPVLKTSPTALPPPLRPLRNTHRPNSNTTPSASAQPLPVLLPSSKQSASHPTYHVRPSSSGTAVPAGVGASVPATNTKTQALSRRSSSACTLFTAVSASASSSAISGFSASSFGTGLGLESAGVEMKIEREAAAVRRPRSATPRRTVSHSAMSVALQGVKRASGPSHTQSQSQSQGRFALTEQEKADKWADLLERSEQAGGTLRVDMGSGLGLE